MMAEQTMDVTRSPKTTMTGRKKVKIFNDFLQMQKDEGDRARFLSPYFFYEQLSEKYDLAPHTIKIYISEVLRLVRKKERLFEDYLRLIKKFGVEKRGQIYEILSETYAVNPHSIKAYIKEIMDKKSNGEE